jgi:hypothetical protein
MTVQEYENYLNGLLEQKVITPFKMERMLIIFKLKNDSRELTVKQKCDLYCISERTYYRYLKNK